MCDLAYTLLVDRMIGEIRAEQHLAAVAMAAGGQVEWPVLDERIAAFDAALTAPPAVVDVEKVELRRALGLRT